MTNIQLQMPDGVQVEEMNETYGRFVVQPLERGYGVTIGNAFRRVLLSSLERHRPSPRIKIDGVQHEFSTVPGVTEDVSDIILNLKGVRFRAHEEDEGTISLHLEGPGELDRQGPRRRHGDFEILNPDHHIATSPTTRTSASISAIGQGRGYVPAEENKRADDPIGVIAVDSIFTPILNVKYTRQRRPASARRSTTSG